MLLRQRSALLRRYLGEVERAEELEAPLTEDVERSAEQWDAQVLSELSATDRRALDDIVAALRRIDDGTFGTCTECAERIAAARLEALPAAATCIECATTAERKSAAPPPFAPQTA
jgi:RNA polymerase-binding transcription factor DksA